MESPATLLLCLGLLLLSVHVQPGSFQDVQTLHTPAEVRKSLSFICPEAIFAFGNSLSDTGELGTVLPTTPSNFPPYGETYPGYPTGRYSDGRLVIDWIALAFFNQVLSVYFDSLNPSAVGADFTHGVDFAVAGATARNETEPVPTFVPWNLPEQVDQMFDFAARAQNGSIPFPVPAPSSFNKKGLYHIEAGGNDVFYQLFLNTPFQTFTDVIAPQIVGNVSKAIGRLHEGVGASQFIVWSVPPVGCTPVALSNSSLRSRPETGYSADTGCLEGVNSLVTQINILLAAALQQLRVAYNKILILEADSYTSIYNVQQNPQEYGFTEAFLVCCGSPDALGYNFNITGFCGAGNTVLCSNPSEYVWWDGIHNTEASYRLFANAILDGTLVTPSVNIAQQCHLNVSTRLG